jgi:L-ascorbate metabolism protein UlaG (beta-lactamase superfamily)
MIKSFGKLPSGNRLERIKKSAHYREGSFQNLAKTPMLAEGTSYPKMIVQFFSKGINREPLEPLPAVKTDLNHLANMEPVIVWFGHSSYLVRIHGQNILVDPVFSDTPSPFSFIGKKGFQSEINYTADDMPESIDLVIITHDHYDHLDYETIKRLKPRVKMFYTSLGVGEHLEYWGVEPEKIVEFDWWEKQTFAHGIEIIAAPARHFSGRVFKRNQSLWSSFILKTDGYSIFVGGDSGYDAAFKTIGDQYGPFDLAILECGQYDKQWPFIHMMPEECPHAALDLKANAFMPVHWGKFTLALHEWNDPIVRTVKKAEELRMPVVTPMIGEPLLLNSLSAGKKWWEVKT